MKMRPLAGPSIRYSASRSRSAAGIGTLRRPCFDFGATSPSHSSQPRSTRITPVPPDDPSATSKTA